MSDDQFTKLFRYMQEFRQEMSGEFSDIRRQINDIYGAIDALHKQSETHEQVRLAMNHQLTRHEEWFRQLAKNTNTKLIPEL